MPVAPITRRTFAATAASTIAFGGAAFARLPLPKSPVTISIVDASGDLALTQRIFENYRQANPGVVSRFTFTKAPEPELPGKLRAQQAANRVDIDLVLAGYDLLSSGIAQNIGMELLPAYQTELPKLEDIHIPGASRIQAPTHGQGVCISFCPYSRAASPALTRLAIP